MIQLIDVSKSFGDRTLLDDVTFSLGRRERIALIGRNGSGKSTLFKIILGETEVDTGRVVFPRDYRVGHLEQHLSFHQLNIIREVCQGLPPDLQDEEYRAEILLAGLGFSESDMQKPASAFSGGFQIRVNLARVLVSEPNLLLLDEPTNYLDIVSARWLSRFLREWDGEVILISHDRTFLDEVCTHTMLIHRQKLRKVQGGIEKLLEQVALDEEVYEKNRISEDKKRKEVEAFIVRFRAQASKAASVQSRMKALEKMGKKEQLQDEAELDFAFSEAPPVHGKFMVEARNISFAYPAHGGKLGPSIFTDFTCSIGTGDRIGVIGKNGRGKSTLLKLLAREVTPQKGEIVTAQNVKLGYFGQTNISRLSPHLTVEEEITAENPTLYRTRVRGICGTMMFSGDDAEKSISVLSGGEKSRVLLGKILANQTNLLLLDEPTNHLDLESIEALVESSEKYSGAIVIVTHSELILRRLATKLIVFQSSGATMFDGGYDLFLKEVGWEEEGVNPTTSNSADTVQMKKAELSKEEEKELRSQARQVEKQIEKLEKKVSDANAKLAESASNGDRNQLAVLSKEAAEAQAEVNAKFGELEAIYGKLG